MEDCGCAKRREWLNEQVPGSGDAVAFIAEPIADAIGYKGRERKMPAILRPDMKSLVWLAIGAFVVPMVLRKF